MINYCDMNLGMHRAALASIHADECVTSYLYWWRNLGRPLHSIGVGILHSVYLQLLEVVDMHNWVTALSVNICHGKCS